MSKMTVEIEKIKTNLDSISGCGGYLEDYVCCVSEQLEAVIKICQEKES